MPRRPAPVTLARRITTAAVELTGGDPNRAVTIEAILGHAGLTRDESTVGAMFEAIQRGWLVVNNGPEKHSVLVGARWTVERAKARRK